MKQVFFDIADLKPSREKRRSNALIGAKCDIHEHCIICNRRINPAKAFQVLPTICLDVLISGDMVATLDDTVGPQEVGGEKVQLDGCGGIGPSCAKKIPKEFRWK